VTSDPRPSTESAQIALAEMRQHFQLIEHSADLITERAAGALSIGGLGTAVGAALQVSGTDTGKSIYHIALLVIAAILFAWLTSSVLKIIAPTRYLTPIDNNWNVIKRGIINKPEYEAACQMVSQYIECIETNSALNAAKADLLRDCYKILATLLGVMLVAAMVP
jgi:hypothetical protein